MDFLKQEIMRKKRELEEANLVVSWPFSEVSFCLRWINVRKNQDCDCPLSFVIFIVISLLKSGNFEIWSVK